MIKNTLFAKYIKERGDKKILENDDGFIIYKITNEECFIGELFVDKEKRGTKSFLNLFNALIKIAQLEGCKTISGTIFVEDPGCTHTLQTAFKCGFRIVNANSGVLLIAKELEA